MAIADKQHADHQLRINRRPTDRTVEGPETPTQIRKINEPIDRAQHVIGWHELVEAKFVKKLILHHEPIAHHRPNPPAARAPENHTEGPIASPFSTKSAQRRLNGRADRGAPTSF